jgi:hypothetical protein
MKVPPFMASLQLKRIPLLEMWTLNEFFFWRTCQNTRPSWLVYQTVEGRTNPHWLNDSPTGARTAWLSESRFCEVDEFLSPRFPSRSLAVAFQHQNMPLLNLLHIWEAQANKGRRLDAPTHFLFDYDDRISREVG